MMSQDRFEYEVMREQWEAEQEMFRFDMDYQQWLDSLNAKRDNEEIDYGTYCERNWRH